MATLTQSICPQPTATVSPGIAVLELAPGDRLPAASSVCVVDGIVYVATDESEFVLTPGDQVSLRAGDAHRAWNAGDERARVILSAAA